jgi:putative hemolysin
MTEVLIILLLILLNGIFAMAEIAMVASRKSALEAAAKRGGKVSKKALELSHNPGKFLSTVQIGITLIGILLGIYSGKKIEDDFERYLNQFELLKPYSETLALTIIVIILTFFSLVLGELVPKRIGLTMPEKISKILAYPMYAISIVAAPFIWLLTFTTDLLLRLFHIKKSGGGDITEEEIKALIQEGTESGTVQEIEQDIVENVFHLGDRTIGTLMTLRENIDWLDTKDALETSGLKISTSLHMSFPVCEGSLDHVKGIIYTKDILNALLKKDSFEIEKHIRPAILLSKSTTAYKALETLRKSKQHVALVVNAVGNVQGILTLDDLIGMLVDDFVQQLHEKKEIIPRSDNSFLIDASLPLPELARYFDIEITNDKNLSQINTVEEFISQFTVAPHLGYEFTWKNLSIEIVDMDGRSIDKVLVKRIL